MVTGDAVELAAALARQPQAGAGTVRPPAIVVEYMGQGSLKGALARKADIVQGPLIRVLIAMDAAKVCYWPLSATAVVTACIGVGSHACTRDSTITQEWALTPVQSVHCGEPCSTSRTCAAL